MRRPGTCLGRRIPHPRYLGGIGDPAQIILGLAPYSFTSADVFTVDGVTGKVATFPDRVAAGTGIRAITANHAMSQAVLANQVAIPTADVLFNNKPTATLLGTTQNYDSTAPASAWTFLHSGTGSEEYHVLTNNSNAAPGTAMVFRSTARASVVTDVGGSVIFTSAAGNDSVNYRVQNGAANIVNGGVSAVDIEPGNAFVLRLKYQEAALPQEAQTIVNGAVLRSANSTGAPSVAAPAATLRHFAEAVVLQRPMPGRWACSIYFDRLLTTDEAMAVQTYLLLQFGMSTL